ncbi:MAG: hypothetical protein Q8M09_15930 [Pseudomonadota bacterium]|nr:hypothetical protein [Pseudomonadota bacterium]MDP1905710.1 hypothetical protein [Pseudomonadota bacterium]MDP2353582.1 hypothetical protein [Pseudomonadota bacterium]
MDTSLVAASAASVANYQTQSSLIALRLAAESQRQVVDLLAQSVAPAANPAHMGSQVDTYA